MVKQASTSLTEYNFWKEMFRSSPDYKIVLYREPDGWLASAKEKFKFDEQKAIEVYKKDLETYEQIGGNAVPYGEEIFHFLSQLPEFRHVTPDKFQLRRKTPPKAPQALHEVYQEFLKKLSRDK